MSSDTSHTNLPDHAVSYLKGWIMSPEHVHHPYPSEEEKNQIMKDTGVGMKQINNWFVNNRKRYWKPRVTGTLTEQQGNEVDPLALPVVREEDSNGNPSQEDESDDDREDATSNEELWESSVAAAQEKQNIPNSRVVSIPPDLEIIDTEGRLRESDVFSSRISYSRYHPGNVFYRNICEKYSRLVYELNYDEKKSCYRIMNLITLDLKGRFLKQRESSGKAWHIMSTEAVLRKISLALRQTAVRNESRKEGSSTSVQKKGRKKKPASRRRSSSGTRKASSSKKQRTRQIVSYQAQAGSNYIHPYTLQIITEVCNVFDIENALSFLDNDMKAKRQPNEKESNEERLQRLQLRHRYYAAWDGNIQPVDFSKRLLEFWGGRLVERTLGEQESKPTVVNRTSKSPVGSSGCGSEDLIVKGDAEALEEAISCPMQKASSELPQEVEPVSSTAGTLIHSPLDPETTTGSEENSTSIA